MSKKAAKRFYKTVNVTDVDGGYGVKLDSYALRTPGKKPLMLPSAHLAGLVAAEWDAQAEHIQPEIMPVTRLMNVAVERTPDMRDELVAEMRKYAGTDVLCYREDNLKVLTARQSERWDPVLNWVKTQHDVVLNVTSGIMAIGQPEDSLDKVAEFARQQDDIALTLLTHFTSVFSSAVLGITVLDGYKTAHQALALSRLDEHYQIELWGQDEEAQERADAIESETLALAKILEG